MQRRSAFAFTLAFTVLASADTLSARESQGSPITYVVIVHPRNPAASVERRFLQDAFLKRVKHWPGETALRPVDLGAGSTVRRRFSGDVLGRSVEAIKAYWQQRIFSGRGLPPPQFDRDAEVIDYVLKHEGAVGYVSASAELRGSKRLAIR